MAPTITLYTAHHCPFAHRIQIALRELELPFETKLVNVNVPRTEEYLAINPNGLVPALIYNDRVLTESSLISQFLLDAHPCHLLKPSSDPEGAVQRFDIGFLGEAYSGKCHPLWDNILSSEGVDAKAAAANKYIDAVVKHVEPLLTDCSPFFGGSNRLTMAEVSTHSSFLHYCKLTEGECYKVLTGPFHLRVTHLPKHEDLVPGFVCKALGTRAPKFWKWAQDVIAEKSVLSVWDEELVVKQSWIKIEKRKRAL